MNSYLCYKNLFLRINSVKKDIKDYKFGLVRDINILFLKNKTINLKISFTIIKIDKKNANRGVIYFPTQHYILTYQQFRTMCELIKNTNLNKFNLQHHIKRFRTNNINLSNLINCEKLLFEAGQTILDILQFGKEINYFNDIVNQLPKDFKHNDILLNPIISSDVSDPTIHLQIKNFEDIIITKNMDFKEIYNLIKRCV